MPVTRWDKATVRGKRVEWLTTLEYAGYTFRLSTRPHHVESDDGTLHYQGTLDAVEYTESVDLFALGGEPTAATVSGYLPDGLTVADLRQLGHDLGSATCEVAQWVEGLTFEQRRVLVKGRLKDPEWGRTGWINFTVENHIYADRGVIPDATARVDESTWIVEGRLADTDLGFDYPVVVGYPGRAPRQSSGWVTAGITVWGSKTRFNHMLIVAGHAVDATTVWINHDGDPTGNLVNVSTMTDLRGRTVSVIDYNANDYDDNAGAGVGTNYLGADYCPLAADANTEIYMGWTGGGVVGADGEVVRRAGDVMAFLLDYSTLRVDRAAFATAGRALDRFCFDFVIGERVTPYDFLRSEILPFVPCSLLGGPNGLYPVVWSPDVTEDRCLAHVDADADPRIEVADRVETDGGDIRNAFELRYGFSVRTEAFLYTARMGADYEDPQGYAEGVLTSGSGRTIPLRATASGTDGQGILVTVASGPRSVTAFPAEKRVAIVWDPGTSTIAQLVTDIRAGGDIVTCDEDDDATLFGAVGSNLTLALADTGTRGSMACKLSQARYEDDDGNHVFRHEAEARSIYDDATADAVLSWWAAAYAFTRQRVTLLAPETEFGWLALGDPVLFSDATLGFARQVAHVEGIEWHDDGLIGLQLLIVENPARDLWGPA